MSNYNDGILPEPCLRMDTHFGDEYESIEFGDGTGYIKAAPILAKVGALHEEIDRLREHVKMPDEPLEIDEKDFYTRAFIKWATEEQPEVKRLEAENEQLRRERDFYFRQVTENGKRAHGAIDTLNAENAKLRELVAALYRCADAGKPCETCPLFDGEGGCLDADRMHELGIEVNA